MAHRENGELAATFGDEPAPGQVRDLGWWRFALQFSTVIVAMLLGAVPPVLLLGQSSAGLAISTLASMVAAIAIAWFWLKNDGAAKVAFNLSRPDQGWGHTLAWAALATGVIIALFAIGAPLVSALGMAPPDVSLVMDQVTQSPATFVMWIVLVAMLSAGLGEELLWRGFLIDRLSRLKGLRGNMVAVLLAHAVLFGLPHAYQGLGGVLITGTIGVFLGWLRFRMNGNLWAGVIGHAAVDVIMLSLGYGQSLGWYGGD